MNHHRSQWIWICSLFGLPLTVSCNDIQLVDELGRGGKSGEVFSPVGSARAFGVGGRLTTGSGSMSTSPAKATDLSTGGEGSRVGPAGESGQSSAPTAGRTATGGATGGGAVPVGPFGGATSGTWTTAGFGGATGETLTIAGVGGATGGTSSFAGGSDKGGSAPTGGHPATGVGGALPTSIGGGSGHGSFPAGGAAVAGGGGRPGQGGSAGAGAAGEGGAGRLPQLGDVNGDGKVNQQDASVISGFLLQRSYLKYPELADVDCDGSITDDDVTCVHELSQGHFEAFRCSFAVGREAAGQSASAGRACGLRTGDVDGDGDVDFMDANRIAHFYVGDDIAPFFWVVADTKCDGQIDITDSLAVDEALDAQIALSPCHRDPADAENTTGAGGSANTTPRYDCPPGAGGRGGAGNAALALGDANGDGSVDLGDADTVARYDRDPESPMLHREVADVDCDCVVDLWDAKQIADYALRTIDHFTCETP